jgi:hypothetical protein
MIGIRASLVELAGVVGAGEADGASEGDGATDGATDAAADALADAVGSSDGEAEAAAATVNVVVPRAMSPSSAEALVQRIV